MAHAETRRGWREGGVAKKNTKKVKEMRKTSGLVRAYGAHEERHEAWGEGKMKASGNGGRNGAREDAEGAEGRGGGTGGWRPTERPRQNS